MNDIAEVLQNRVITVCNDFSVFFDIRERKVNGHRKKSKHSWQRQGNILPALEYRIPLFRHTEIQKNVYICVQLNRTMCVLRRCLPPFP